MRALVSLNHVRIRKKKTKQPNEHKERQSKGENAMKTMFSIFLFVCLFK